MSDLLNAAGDLPTLSDVLPVIGGIAIAVVGGGMAIWSRWGGDRARARQPLPPTWPEMWERMDKQDEKIAALTRIVVAAADQWPTDVAGPVFQEADLAVLEETLPAKWLIQHRPKTT